MQRVSSTILQPRIIVRKPGVCRPDAPGRVFSSSIPESTPNNDLDLRRMGDAITPVINGQMIEWPEVAGVSGYEIHWSEGDMSRRGQTLIGTVPAGQTKYFFDPQLYQNMAISSLVVSPIWNKSAVMKSEE